MALSGAEPVSSNPLRPMLDDLAVQRRAGDTYPPGPASFSIARPRQMLRDPLKLLLDNYARYGPVFTLGLFTSKVVVLLGPEANHHLLVANAKNFSWRQGSMANLIPLLGDGLLTIDGDFHRSSRKVMLPGFQRERIAASMDVMIEEVDRALDEWGDGDAARVDVYAWTRDLALRIAMRALFGLDPHGGVAVRIDAARLFEEALSFYSYDMPLQLLRGPRTPYARMRAARKELDRMIYAEIGERRRSGERGMDLLSLLLDAEDDEGQQLSDRQIRDEVMTMLFAGHDTTTSTVAFMFYELLRRPEWIDRLRAEAEEAGGGERVGARQFMAGELPLLDQVLDETLRLYPPAWVGPRKALEAFEVCGQRVPAGAAVIYSSWASHRLPDVFDDPDAFRPERFAEEEKAKLPRGAYVPFGGGSRQCIGMRFGQLEIRAIVTEALRRFDVAPEPGYELRVRQQPTIGPADGMPVRVTPRR
jgi:cytochrome P450